jgi:hypothetical protein
MYPRGGQVSGLLYISSRDLKLKSFFALYGHIGFVATVQNCAYNVMGTFAKENVKMCKAAA